MERVKRFFRILVLVFVILLASIGMGITGAAPVYSKNRDALSENKTEQEQVTQSEQVDENEII